MLANSPSHQRKILLQIVLALGLVAVATAATSHQPTATPRLFEGELARWRDNIKEPIARLFWLLVTLDFAWTAIQLGFKASGLEDFTSTILKKILFYGVGVLLLTRGSEFASLIGQSFTQLAGIAAGTTSDNPARDIWDLGLDALSGMYDNSQDISILKEAVLVFCVGLAMIALIALCAYMCLTIIIVQCEFIIVVSLTTIALAFNASSFTIDYGRKYLHNVILSGVRLFATITIAYFGIELIEGWIEQVKYANPAPIFYGLGGLFIFAYLMKSIPDRIVSALSGGGVGSSALDIGGSAVKMAAAGVMTAATGGAAAIGAARSLAKEGSGSTAGNLAKAFAQDMKGSFSEANRDIQNRPGLDGAGMGQRMAATMDSAAKGIRKDKAQESGKDGNSISKGEGNSPSTGSVASNSQNQFFGMGGGDSGGGESGEELSSGSGGDPNDTAAWAGGADSGSPLDKSRFDATGDNMGTTQGDSGGQISNAGGSAAPTAPQIRNTGGGTSAPSTPTSSFTPPVGTTVAANSSNAVGGSQIANSKFDPTGDNMVKSNRLEKIREQMENFRPRSI